MRCPSPLQHAHSISSAGRPAARIARAAGVSLTGRDLSMTPRLRSSLHTAAAIGTGSPARRPIWLVATGSARATTRSTSRTPDAPSARPTAMATSAAIASMSIGALSRPPRASAGPAVSCHIMPVIEPASRFSELRRQEAASPKTLYAVDAISAPDSPVHDVAELSAASSAAVRAGGGHVLDTSHVIFPNGAITLVLILAESHLSVHTWPEENMVAIDLFSCGKIDGNVVIGHLARGLRLQSVTITQVPRGAAVTP